MTGEISSLPSSQLSIIVDLTSPFDFKALYNNLSSQPPANSEHHYWHFGGLRSYTIPFSSNANQTTINSVISKLKALQKHRSLFPPFWILHKECQPPIPSSPPEVIKKNLKLGRFYTNNIFQIEYTSGALVQLDKYVYDIQTEIKDGWRAVFYHDRIDIDYGLEKDKLRKTLKAELIDRCVVIMTEQNSLTLFINMTGNTADYKGSINDENRNSEQDSSVQKSSESSMSYKRTAPGQSQPFYSTIRLVISLAADKVTEENRDEHWKRLKYCYVQFQEFFYRNHINDCFGIITSTPSTKDFSLTKSKFMSDKTMSFIKQYCWQMLLSIGYRFQQRLTEGFIQHMNLIEDDDEFYQVNSDMTEVFLSTLLTLLKHSVCLFMFTVVQANVRFLYFQRILIYLISIRPK
jgi:hypothetical protein